MTSHMKHNRIQQGLKIRGLEMHDFTLDPKILRYADFMMTLLRFYEELTWTLFGFNCPHEMQFHNTTSFF